MYKYFVLTACLEKSRPLKQPEIEFWAHRDTESEESNEDEGVNLVD